MVFFLTTPDVFDFSSLLSHSHFWSFLRTDTEINKPRIYRAIVFPSQIVSLSNTHTHKRYIYIHIYI